MRHLHYNDNRVSALEMWADKPILPSPMGVP